MKSHRHRALWLAAATGAMLVAILFLYDGRTILATAAVLGSSAVRRVRHDDETSAAGVPQSDEERA